MLNVYSRDKSSPHTRISPSLEPNEAGRSAWCDISDDMVWLDLYHPDREEEHYVEGVLGIGLPTREDMNEIEFSSRLYLEDGAAFMTAQIAFFGERDHLQSGPVTFVLLKNRLVTIRYIDPKSFDLFADRVIKSPELCGTAFEALANLLDVLIDRTADLLERTSASVEAISAGIFAPKKSRNLEKVLRELGRCQSDTARIRDSLGSLARLLLFARGIEAERIGADAHGLAVFRQHLLPLDKDVQSLNDHVAYVASNITFLHEAALGMINIEQNAIIKIFSVASVAFLPPTLIASVYGMNFQHMPELHQPWAYPVVLVAMVASSIGPLIWFKAKGWL
jgi:magnesium transporter